MTASHPPRRPGAWIGASALILACALATPARAQRSAGGPAKPAQGSAEMQRMLAPGPEARRLARRVGTWDVVMTIRVAPGARPMVVRGMVAERTMVGLYLTEVMKPAPGTRMPDFRRTDTLTFNKLQSRWDYVSMDTRAPIGIMYARSHASEPGPTITVYFDNFANPGIGPLGQTLRARHVDSQQGANRELKRQYWTRPGGEEWLAIEYEYTR